MNYKNTKKLLILGLFSSILTVAGEMIGAFAPSTPTNAIAVTQMKTLLENTFGTNALNSAAEGYFNCFENLAAWQTGLGALIGCVGIMAQFAGVYGLYHTFDSNKTRSARWFIVGGAGYTLLGSAVHVVCCAAMYIYKITAQSRNCWETVIEFVVWFMLPITALFFVFYGIFSVILFIQIIKKRTPFPKWCCVLNPITGKIVFNAIASALPSSPFSNAVANANMGLTSIVMFAIFLILYKPDITVKEENSHEKSVDI